MFSQQTILGEVAHFHPLLRVMPTIEHDAAKKSDQRRILKRMQCKTCQGKACTGRCRFGD